MPNSNLMRDWHDFLKILAFDSGLTPTEGKVLLERFFTPIKDDFYCITHESVANKIFPKNADPCGSLRGHLSNVYRKLGYGAEVLEDNNKAKIIFPELKQKFDLEQEQKRIAIKFLKDKAEQLNDFLLHLNYTEEEGKFHDFVSSLDRSGVFLAEIRGDYTQRWLAKRLMVKNQILKGYCSLGIEPSRNWRDNIDLFWQFLAKSDTYDCSQQDVIIQKVVARMMQVQGHQNGVLIAIYNVHKLQSDDVSHIIEKFWLPFQAMMRQESYLNNRECVLLLMGNPGWAKNIDRCCSPETLVQIPLPVWGEITEQHVGGWLRGDGILSFCEQHSEKSTQDVLKFLDVRNNPCTDQNIGEPEDILEKICTLVNLPNGIAELEQYWKLSS